MRILMISSLFAPEIGGVCAVTEALASNLPDQVIVAAPATRMAGSPGTDWAAYDRRFAFQVHRLPSLGTELSRRLPPRIRGPLQFAWNLLWTRPRAAASLDKLLASHPVDVVCIQTLGTYWIAATLQRRNPRLKVVFYLHGEEIAGAGKPNRMDLLQHKALRRADAVIAVSSFTRDAAVRVGVDPEKITVIHNGVDTEVFKPAEDNAAVRERLGLTGRRVLLCLARLDERKGQDKLIEAMPVIVTAVPGAILLIVGGGPDASRLQELAAVSPVRPHVTLIGPVRDEDRLPYYQAADVYVMPNRQLPSGDTEGFGLVFLEAGACAKPVVGGRAGGVPDAVLDGMTGYLVDGQSPNEIAEACIRLLSNPGLAATLGARGLAHSRQHTWKMQSQRFLDVCKKLCEQDTAT